MPSLRMFNRRWHTASDAMPAMAGFLFLFHAVWFVLYWFGTYDLESTGLKFGCDQAYLLRAANYSLFGLCAISAVLELTIMGVGLRGGPLETTKRNAMAPLLYLEIALWLTLFCFTIFGTYVIASPTIAETCWETNPCYVTEATEGLPNLDACKLRNGTSVPEASPSCLTVFTDLDHYSACFNAWFLYGFGWNATRSWSSPGDCRLGTVPDQLKSTIQVAEEDSMDIIVIGTEHNHHTASNATAVVHRELLHYFHLPITGPTAVQSAPWWFCHNTSCQTFLIAGEECNQWDVLDQVRVSSASKKNFFEGLIYSSWAVLALTAVVGYITFNSRPEFSDVDSWEETLKSLASTCCCGSKLETAQGGSGDPASREIARSLHMLFGGIDLDPSDRLLGMYLVSEQQSWRRQRHVARALEAAGVVRLPDQPGAFSRAWQRLAAAMTGKPGRTMQQPASQKASGAPEAKAEPLTPHLPTAQGLGSNGSLSAGPPPFPASPFDSPANSVDVFSGSGSSSRPPLPSRPLPYTSAQPAPSGSVQRNLLALLPMYRHSMLRLQTCALEGPVASAAGSQGMAQQGQQQGQGQHRERGQQGSEAVGDGGPLKTGGDRPAAYIGGSRDRKGRLGKAGVGIKLAQRFHPMLTPSGCTKALPITPQQAAGIYTGYHEPVPKGVLEEAQRNAKFAVGAYGLQSIVWGKGKRPAMCAGNLNMLVKCLGKPLRLESKFRKRNLNAIMDVTGAQPSDLLYVSYANAPGGSLPYMLMLNRQSKSLVLAVRGTVSMEDLITDLLSTPLEVAGWMPDWVNEANTSGEGLYAHAGIVGSATAILSDLEDRGLLQELLYAQLVKTHSAAGQDVPSKEGSGVLGRVRQMGAKLAFWHRQQGGKALSPSHDSEGQEEQSGGAGEPGAHGSMPDLGRMSGDQEVQLPLGRAQTIMREKLQREGWQVVVTGHSLGAAVACMLSFHLRDIFPDLRCWAFNPPGGLLSWNLSRLSQRFCTSVVVGKDVISRLSFSTSKRLVDEMVTSLARCKRPKLAVLGDMLFKQRSASQDRTFCSYHEMSDEAVQALEGYHKTSFLHSRQQVELYPPGRLAFLRPFKGPRRSQQAVWDAVWVEAPALMGEGILVSPSMMSHHRVFLMRDALRSALEGEAAEAQQGLAAGEAPPVLQPPV